MARDEPVTLNSYAADVHSQSGEDGVIAEILRRIGEGSRWCVEFGAWDGQHASNTAALVERGWSAVLIEGDENRAELLARRHASTPDVHPIEAFVGWHGPARLDHLLAGTAIPTDFDLLSIDIDGNDYHVWDALETYRPRVVVIEFNPTVPNGIDFVQERDATVHQGSSIDALTRLARSKGYHLVAATEFNAFYVLEELVDAVGVHDTSIAAIRTDTSWQTQVFFGFDGTAHLVGERGLYWHGVPMPHRIHVMPRLFEGFPGTHGSLRNALFRVWRGQRRIRAHLASRRRS